MRTWLLFLASNELTHTPTMRDSVHICATPIVTLMFSVSLLAEGFPQHGCQQMIPFLKQPDVRKRRFFENVLGYRWVHVRDILHFEICEKMFTALTGGCLAL